ncbi:MAG: glycosyltransferase family 2 protein [Solirubrobacteraceae bacterium]
MAPSASIIVPTRGRPDYLDVALASIVEQAGACGAEVIVVDDGRDRDTERVAASHGARYLSLGSPRGLNAARNAGISVARAPLIILVDDDVEVAGGWLAAYIEGAAELADVGVFSGPIRARFEGRGATRRTCGREGPPITHADHGAADRDVSRAWGANLALRQSAFTTVGPFDERRPAGSGDEEDWEERYLASGGRIRYLAAAGLDHRRNARDSALRALCRAAAHRGVASRRYDESRGETPSLGQELRTLIGCVWHTLRRRCANGPPMVAHTAGRITAALRPPKAGAPGDPRDDFLTGESGTIGGKRDALRALQDLWLDVLALPTRLALARAARGYPPTREVLVICAWRQARAATYDAAIAELRRSRHSLTLAARDVGTLGRFENFNELLAGQDLSRFDWLLLLDDDVVLPRGFLDGLIHQAERHELRLAQPAHRIRSHSAYRVTRRRAHSAVRETAFVEIGPVTALHRETFGKLVPFPPLRMGWGLDAHWSAIAREQGWPIGVIDALPVAHRVAPAAALYSREAAVSEAREFLAEHPYLPQTELQRTFAVHRRVT